jgi:hypothetical protein
MQTLSKFRTGLVLVVATAGLAGCVTDKPSDEGIGYRQARFDQIQAMRDYQACTDQGVELDRQARTSGEPGRYLAAARVLEGCETKLGEAAETVDVEDRMRSFGLSIHARIKGGDLDTARKGLDSFLESFRGRDLYFDDGTSFIETTRALLSAGGENTRGPRATANISTGLGDELRRIAMWRRK